MTANTLQGWLDWWESKGQAISMCYLGNGGSVVTIGTQSQTGTVSTGTSGSGDSGATTSTQTSSSGTSTSTPTSAEPTCSEKLEAFLSQVLGPPPPAGQDLVGYWLVELLGPPPSEQQVMDILYGPGRLLDEIQHIIHDQIYDPYHNHPPTEPPMAIIRGEISVGGQSLAFSAQKGSEQADIMTVLTGTGMLWGLSGDDSLSGGSSHDWLDGGIGEDVLSRATAVLTESLGLCGVAAS